MTVAKTFGWLVLGMAMFASQVQADLRIEDAWCRATPPGGHAAAIYMRIRNPGDEAVIITDISTALGQTMLHESSQKSGMATMRHVDELTVPPMGEVRLQPRGLHIMLTGLGERLNPGDDFVLEVGSQSQETQKRNTQTVEVVVRPLTYLSK